MAHRGGGVAHREGEWHIGEGCGTQGGGVAHRGGGVAHREGEWHIGEGCGTQGGGVAHRGGGAWYTHADDFRTSIVR